MSYMKEKKISGVSFLTFPSLDEYGLFCGFTSRKKGFSSSPYDSLNLAYHVGDERENVKKNRGLLLKKILKTDGSPLYSAHQVHGKDMIEVREDTIIKEGDIPEDADALMTGSCKTPIMVMGADCIIMAFADIVNRAVCTVHAGWKGTRDRITSAALTAFSMRFGSSSDSIRVFIGPGIRECCYQVGDDRAAEFAGKDNKCAGVATRRGKIFLDLALHNHRQALDLGIPPENIFDTGICTCCSSDYFSYRRDGITGRQAAVAMVY